MRDLLESNDSAQFSGYISENLALLKGSPFGWLTQLTRAPFRIGEMRLLVAGRGGARLMTNLEQYEIRAGDMMFVSGGSIAQIESAAADVEAFGLSCTDELLALAFDNRLPTILKRPQLSFVVHLSEAEHRFIETLHTLLGQAVRKEAMSPQVVLHLVAAILSCADHLYAAIAQRQAAARSHEEDIFDRFISLVNTYGSREHKLEFYADKTFLSPRYLGAVVKKVSGRTAKDWIDEAVIMKAKVMLKHSDMPVGHIASALAFENYSFFSRYFRRLTGLSPMAYRQS